MESILFLEPLGFIGNHAAPAASHPHGIGARKDIVSAGSSAVIGEPRVKRQARGAAVGITRRKAVVKLERVDEVDSTSSGVVCTARGVDVGGKEQLCGVDGVKVDIVDVQNLVENHAVGVYRSQGAVADFGKEGDAFEA